MGKAIPVISFVGYSDSGKTTFIEKLIDVLKSRGIECAYLKHTHHDDIVEEMIKEENLSSKDTSKILNAGAKVSAIVSDGELVWMQKAKPDIKKIISLIDGVDVIIIEGFKKSDFPKVMVTTSADPKDWPVLIDDCLAVVSDFADVDKKPVFKRDDTDSFTEWMIENIIR